jgi:3-dehydroquinate synthase/2-deoxy-scyllo-inosose synthase
MLCAAEIANRAFDLSDDEVEAHRVMLARIGVSKARARGIPSSRVLELLRFDNKRGYAPGRPDELPMILLDGLGRPRMGEARPLVPVTFADVERVVRALSGPRLVPLSSQTQTAPRKAATG